MINLCELRYRLQKGIYFSGKVDTFNYNIYYNNKLSDMYWNFALVSNIISIQNNIPDIVAEFKKLNRTPCIYINSLFTKELNEIQENKFRVNYTETWMRHEIEMPLSKYRGKKVEKEKECNGFIELFRNEYSVKNAYLQKIREEHIQELENCLKSSNTVHFISYENDTPVACASLGWFEDYYMIFNQSLNKEYDDSYHKEAIINSCIEYCKNHNGKSLIVKIATNRSLEKWYGSLGFRMIASGCRLSL